jgi:hypothetical protein
MMHDVPIRYIAVPYKFYHIGKRPNMIWPAALSTFVLNMVRVGYGREGHSASIQEP